MPAFKNERANNSLIDFKAGPEHKAGKVHTASLEFDIEDPNKIDKLFVNFMMAKTLKIRLNGTLVLDQTFERPDARPINILLKPVTHELLEKDKNSLIIEFQTGGEGFITSLKTN